MSAAHQNTADGNEASSLFPNDFNADPSVADFALEPFPGNVTDGSDFGPLGLDNLFPATNSVGDLWSVDPQWSNNISLAANPAQATETGSSTPELPADSSGGALNARPPPKVGTRFSKEAVSILRQWLFSHEADPYPSEEEKNMLQSQTGLSKTQIANWLANARRRGMMQQPARSVQKESSSSSSKPIEIPRRPGTPNPLDKRHLNPLERWFDSPPEDEPAAASAIARALASRQSRVSSPRDAGSNRSESDHSPAHPSSTGTSRSGSSFSSVRSHSSRGLSLSRPSTGSRPSRVERSRYKKRVGQRRNNARSSLAIPLDRFQCTFCTETFRTKHDWQRHEKSIHLPLDRWICTPDGPRIINEQSGSAYCVFCGETDPDGPHIEGHNPSFCRERTFSRKDHLKQHLHLVHNAPLVEKLTRNWKIPPPQVRSRCGFCGIAMDTWEFRVDHLADHFKMGQTMAHWKGDWGFEPDILKMVENSIPPYLIDSERRTPAPFTATNTPIESPRHAYELIQSELAWFLQTHDHHNQGVTPNHDALQLEACRIIFAAEVMMMEENTTNIKPTSSWLRDLITSREDIAQQAQFSPIRSQAESALLVPKLYGKKTLFDECPLESQLHDFVRAQWALHHKVLTDSELQVEACRLVSCICQELMVPADNTVATWLIMLISSSTGWLAGFRQRAYNPIASEPSPSLGTMDFTMQQPTGLQHELSFNPNTHGSLLQGNGNTIGPSLASNAGNAHDQANTSLDHVWESMGDINLTGAQNASMALQEATPSGAGPTDGNNTGSNTPGPDHRPSWVKTNLYFVTDANFHRWLARELGRWAAATMSPNNPNSHTPTDEELRHQARCILYDDDDPWNPTAADNAEWLRRFKSEFNIPLS
ncbi:hypothetical protein BGZ63DRAFT_391940 [Mariannaea sp. PMI_226]|nr:hypothetical protein BGZ63DRAFT_391940 [Mariannaea sp. PMI_226]